MARKINRQKEPEITPEGIRRAMELDKDKIEAALAGAVTNNDGSHPSEYCRKPVETPSASSIPPPEKREDEAVRRTKKLDAESSQKDDGGKNPPAEQNAPTKDESAASRKDDISRQNAAKQKKFCEDCLSLNIDAKQCLDQSLVNSDKSIVEHLREINKKIFTETQKGGCSSAVKFRVTPTDWVNVRHIIDWYKARGFAILDYETTHPQLGPNAGTIEYTFTISWAEAR